MNLKLPPDSERVVDADEEIFLLYSDMQLYSSTRGLGHVDSKMDSLTFHILDRDIEIAQDKTSLRSRKGDTGSVVWNASVDFASAFPSLFDIANAHVLELGAGTGFLSIALSPHVRHYTVTDIPDLIPLIRKNLLLNFPSKWPNQSNVSLSPLDWIQLQNASPSIRSKAFQFDPPGDILLVVDCIYHPSLIPPLVETIDHLSIPDRTTVVVVVELRAEDVVREFLESWLARPSWEIWRAGVGAGEGGKPIPILNRPYVMWIGTKLGSIQDTTTTTNG